MTSIRQLFIKPHYFFWVTLAFASLMLGSYIFSLYLLLNYGTYEKDLGWKSIPKENFYVISEVTPDSEAFNKLQVGDKILAINGDTSIQKNYVILSNFSKVIRKVSINQPYTIDISRNSIQQKFTLTCKQKRNYEQLGILITFFLCSLVFSICAFLLGASKPEQKLTRKLSLAFFTTSAFFLAISIRLISPMLYGLDYIFYLILSLSYPIFFALGYAAYLEFPPGVVKGRFWVTAKYFLYTYSTILLALRQLALLDYNKPDSLPFINYLFNNDFLLSALDKAWVILIQLTIALLVLVIIRNYKNITDLDQRRRLKWVAYASVIGLIPLLITYSITIFLSPSTHKYIISTYYYLIFASFAQLCLTIIPLSFVYVIIKHQVFDINVVIRSGLQYLLAKGFLRIVLISEMLAIFAIFLLNPNLTIGELLSPKSFYFYILVSTIISFVYQKQIVSWLDKVFFRKAYNREKVLIDLIEEIKKLNSISEISKIITSSLEQALHPKSIYFFYRSPEKESLSLEHYSGNLSKTQHILANSSLFQIIEDNPVIQEINLIDSLPVEEKEWLASIDAQMIVPIIGQEKLLIGLLLLGEKLSDQPYSKNDCKLLEAISSQLGIVYENTLLKEKVVKENKIKQNVLSKLEEKNIHLVKECPHCNKCFNSDQEFCDVDKNTLILSLPVERVIDGKYRLDKLIGKGGMGAVYAAIDLRLDRLVAVKILHGNLFGDQEAIRRFEREAKASAKLTHPNIVSVYDYGKFLDFSSGAYLIMEMVSGISLADKIYKEVCLEPKIVADLFNQILEAMKVAHKAGIIHRDLKPENILISEENNKVKILDFGIAKIKRIDITNSNSLTEPGTVIGTFGYMPPEQFSAEEVDERSDIFALGIMVIEALTGERPFSGRNVYELMGNMLKETFNLPGESPEIQNLDRVLQKCIAKTRKERFSSIADMQAELIPAISKCSASLFFNPNKINSENDVTKKFFKKTTNPS